MATNGNEKSQTDQQRQSEEILLSIRSLCNLKEDLRNQINECLVQKSLNTDDNEFQNLSKEILYEKFNEARAELIKVEALSRLRDDLSQTWPQAAEACRAMYPSHFPPDSEDENFSAEQRTSVRKKMFELQDLNKEIISVRQQRMKLKQRSLELDKEIEEITARNKESFQILQHQKNKNVDCSKNMTEAEKSHAANMLKQLRCIKHIFQSLIQASQIDWSEDEELRQLVFRLGESEGLCFNIITTRINLGMTIAAYIRTDCTGSSYGLWLNLTILQR